jgi:hypothetical protein
VYIDGVHQGDTPLIGHPVPAGDHTLKLVNGDEEVTQSITVGRRAPTRYFWKAGEPLQVSF